jgi:hypothetical protein
MQHDYIKLFSAIADLVGWVDVQETQHSRKQD